MNLFEKLKTNMPTPSLLKKKGHFVVEDSIGISLLTALNYYENKGSYLIVTSNLYKAQSIYSKLCSFIPKNDVLLFPADELIRAEMLAQTKEMVATRLYTLNELINKRGKIVVANLASATRYLPDIDLFKTMFFCSSKRCFTFPI